MAEVQPTKSACPHQEAVGTRWGDPISAERQVELKALADKQQEWAAQPEATRGDSVFKDVRLTGADVLWLAVLALAGPSGDTAQAEKQLVVQVRKDVRARLKLSLPALHLEGANLGGAHLEKAFIRCAHLERTHLNGAHLEGADLRCSVLTQASLQSAFLESAVLLETHVERARLDGAHLEEADLGDAHFEGAELGGALLGGAEMWRTHLEGASLFGAHLEGADLGEAHLEGTDLRLAHLEGKVLSEHDQQHLMGWVQDVPKAYEPANLQEAFFDTSTRLGDVVLGSIEHGFTAVADVRWGGVNLAVVPDWSPFTEQHIPIGDERMAWVWKPEPFTESELQRKQPRQRRLQARQAHAVKQADARLTVFQVAVRANRQLATTLHTQGMNEQSDYFAYRAQVLRRAVLRQQRKWGRAFGSWLLDRVAGYGYQPMRSVFTYLLVVGLFAVA